MVSQNDHENRNKKIKLRMQISHWCIHSDNFSHDWQEPRQGLQGFLQLNDFPEFDSLSKFFYTY